MELKDKRVLVYGAGRSGIGAADLLAAAGASPVLYADKTDVSPEEIRKQLNFTSLRFHRLDDMVKSVGIPKEKLCTYCWDKQGDCSKCSSCGGCG